MWSCAPGDGTHALHLLSPEDARGSVSLRGRKKVHAGPKAKNRCMLVTHRCCPPWVVRSSLCLGAAHGAHESSMTQHTQLTRRPQPKVRRGSSLTACEPLRRTQLLHARLQLLVHDSSHGEVHCAATASAWPLCASLGWGYCVRPWAGATVCVSLGWGYCVCPWAAAPPQHLAVI